MSLWFTFAFSCAFLIVGSNIFIVESALGVKINKLADRSLPEVRKVAEQIGFDPLKAPPVMDDLSLATINLTDGVILGGSEFERNNNVVISLVPSLLPTVRINASIFFPQLLAKFNYSLEAFVYTDSGSLDALIENVTAHVTLDYRVVGLLLSNPTFIIDHFGDVTVNMTSDSYISWLQNIIADNAIPFYKDHIAEISQKTINLLAKKSLQKFNKNRFKFAAHAVFKTINKILGF